MEGASRRRVHVPADRSAAPTTLLSERTNGEQMTVPGGDRERSARSLDRLVFFSDAVVAIAITLLVIELHLPDLGPHPSDADLRSALAGLAPQIGSVVLSFVVIAVWWATHHRFFASVVRLDSPLLVLDLAFLGAIAFLPFPTNILGQTTTLPTAVALYAATNALIGYLVVAMRQHADRADLLATDIDLGLYRGRTVRSLMTPTVFLISIPIAFVSGQLAAWSWNLVWVLIIVLRRLRGPTGPY